MWPLFFLAGAGLGVLALTSRKAAAATREPTAPPTPTGAASSPEARDIARRAMATIRQVESGNDYNAQNKTSSASGAYQFLDSTWGKYRNYWRAKNAPPEVQDAKAAELIAAIQKRFGLDPKWIPAAWYAGMRGAAEFDWNQVLPGGNKSSVAQYVTKWLGVYDTIA